MARYVNISFDDLTGGGSAPSYFELALDNDASLRLQVGEAVRWVPSKRLVAKGRLQNKDVYVKLFFSGRRGASAWEHEVHCLEFLRKNNIPCPEIVYSGTAMEGKVCMVVMAPIAPARPLGDVWHGDLPDAEKLVLLKKMMDLLAFHHHCGVLQHDLHWDNFLLKNEVIYTLDAGDLSLAAGSLSRDLRQKQLIQFFSLLLPHEDCFIMALLTYYNGLPSVESPVMLAPVQAGSCALRRKKYKKYIGKKIFRRCSEFYCHRTFKQVVLCNRSFMSDIESFLFNPDLSLGFPETVMLKEGNSCTVWLVKTATKKYVVKRYNMKNLGHRSKRFFRATNGAHSWRAAHLLQCCGILTPKPVALIEERFGPCRGKAYLITEFMEGLDFWDFFFDNSQAMANKEQRALQTKELFDQLRRNQIRHGDMKGQNLMVTATSVGLIDLDDMRQFSLPLIADYWHRRDIKRFIKNWLQHPDLLRMFTDVIGK